MAKQSVKRGVTVLDPMFYIPEGTDEFVYSDGADATATEVVDGSVEPDTFVDVVDDADYSDAPDTPDILGVVSQTMRTSATGNQVVDLVLEVEDISALSKYDIRVTKI